MAESTYYDILEVVPTATSSEVKAAYRKLANRVHPDQGGSTALFRQVQEAYETLDDPSRRAAYNAALARGTSDPPWVWWRLGLLDSNQILVGPLGSVGRLGL